MRAYLYCFAPSLWFFFFFFFPVLAAEKIFFLGTLLLIHLSGNLKAIVLACEGCFLACALFLELFEKILLENMLSLKPSRHLLSCLVLKTIGYKYSIKISHLIQTHWYISSLVLFSLETSLRSNFVLLNSEK